MVDDILSNPLDICFRRTIRDNILVYTTPDNEYIIYSGAILAGPYLVHSKKPTNMWITTTHAEYNKLIALAEDYWGMSIADITYGTIEYKVGLEAPGVSIWLT